VSFVIQKQKSLQILEAEKDLTLETITKLLEGTENGTLGEAFSNGVQKKIPDLFSGVGATGLDRGPHGTGNCGDEWATRLWPGVIVHLGSNNKITQNGKFIKNRNGHL
jgi:hypothetical protein